jgi:hypothetical protein
MSSAFWEKEKAVREPFHETTKLNELASVL